MNLDVEPLLTAPPGGRPMGERRFAIIGVGSAGSNVVDRLLDSGMGDVVFIAADTDTEALSTAQAPNHLQLTDDDASSELRDRLRYLLTDVTSVVLVVGLGGATGTRAAVQFARLADSLGVEIIGVATTPFYFEGKRRRRLAEAGLASLTDAVDALFPLSNQRLLMELGARSSLAQAFERAEDAMAREVVSVLQNLSAS